MERPIPPLLRRMAAMPWLREALLFVGFFVLNALNAWQFINSWAVLGRELAYFSLLYAYALLHRFLLLPRLFDTNRLRPYALLTLLTLLPYAWLFMLADGWLYAEEYLKEPPKGPLYLYMVACLVVSTLLFNVPTLVERFYRQRRREDEYRILRQQVELGNLRSQLNPHFLFNTLNNLYGLSLRHPDRAPDLILQLAGLMRYQLASADQPLVRLSDELSALGNYVALENERVGSRCRVAFAGPEQVADDLRVAPMLLLPFVENAFKHGTAGAESCRVSVQIEVNAGEVCLLVSNSLPRRAKPVVSTGVGLTNTRQRLCLLYPARHRLVTEQSAEEYRVDLRIQLTHSPVYATPPPMPAR